MEQKESIRATEPMWPSLLVLLATGALYYLVMPDELAIGPRWLLIAIVAALLIPGQICHLIGKHQMCKVLGYAAVTIVTLAMISSVAMLVVAITHRTTNPVSLLHSAGILWVTNVAAFAVWYWRLDAGGPHARSKRESHDDGAFLFPQMTIPDSPDGSSATDNWSPQLVDYLFLAFNTSTALSPTDVPVLSRWAKVLMMLQSFISLTIVVLLAARAVNVL